MLVALTGAVFPGPGIRFGCGLTGPALRASVLVRNSSERSELLLVGAMLDSVQSGLPPPPLPHCTDEGTEAQKGEATSPRP